MTKKNIFLLAFFALLLISSCTSEKENKLLKNNPIVFDTLVVEQKEHLRNNENNPYCALNLHFVYPSKATKIDLNKIQQIFIKSFFGRIYHDYTPQEAIDMYANNFIKNYKTDARLFDRDLQELEIHADLLPQDLENEHENNLQTEEFYSYSEELYNKVLYNKNNLISFQVKQSNKKGSSAQYSTIHNYVVHTKTGELLSEEDVFVAGYESILQQLFEETLMRQNNVKSVADLEDLGYFGIDEIMPNKNFLIDDNGITYTFNKGEYSAYLLDAPEVFIPYNELKIILKEDKVVSKIAEQ